MENDLKSVVNNVDDKRVIKIILSILLVLCCLVCGSISASVYYLNSLARENASIAATEKSVATQDAATAQGHATATSISHATQVAEYEIFDDFDSNPHHWYVEVEDNDRWNGTISVRDGLYIWDIEEIKDPGSFSWRDYDDQKIVQDFDVSVDAKLVKGSPQLLCYGVAFRSSPRSFRAGTYMFSICDSGVYSVRYYNTESKSESISSWTPAPAIRSGEWNTLSVRARGDQIVLSINNVIINEFTDTHLQSGYIYLVARIFGDQPGTIYFDNFGFQSYSE